MADAWGVDVGGGDGARDGRMAWNEKDGIALGVAVVELLW